MADIYGIGNAKGKIVQKGFSREEALSYVEYEGSTGEYIIRNHRGVWYSVASGKTLGEIRKEFASNS